MSIQANTRIFKGATLKVDDLALSYITCSVAKNANFQGTVSKKIDETNAASSIHEYVIDIPDPGTADFEITFDPDDAFQQEMATMQDNGETRTFKYSITEGTKKVCTFSAWVMKCDGIDAPSRDSIKTSLTLKVVSAKVWAAT